MDEKKAGILISLTFAFIVTDFLHKIDLGWIMMIGSALMFFPGIGVLKGEHLGKMNMSMLFFVAGAMCIGPVAAKVGVVKNNGGYVVAAA